MVYPRKWLTLAGIFTWLLIAYVDIPRSRELIELLIISAGYLSFLACFILVVTGLSQKIAPLLTHGLLFGELAIALLLIFLGSGSLTPVLLVVWAGQLPDFISRSWAFVLVLISSLGLYALLAATQPNIDPLMTGLIFFGFQLFALLSSLSRVGEQHARQHAEQLNQQLLATRVLLAQSSKRDERMRIARDLHDILGHQLTALNVQLELLSHQVPQALRPSVVQSKGLAQELLDTIRAVVRDQRTGFTLDIGKAIETALINLPEVRLTVQGALQLDSVVLAEQLVLCLQEGISNAVRHGRATQLELLLNQQDELIVIRLVDNGRGFTGKIIPGAGLTGMSERLSVYQGQVKLIPQQQGCCLTLSCSNTGKNDD
ncbi:MAG TPA: histidine kinase [Cellvibrionaceae bacterium]|nr:histidine kinase [Cellvibrionaceae bacterium]HMW72994.1 histidine kinase [Cellvibrionaceae bacterium]HMY37858.1 histidine kinase [Marinagarivorans sp.]HNG58495.1 histidine kinase [Cellvibrionaceae bacterium]